MFACMLLIMKAAMGGKGMWPSATAIERQYMHVCVCVYAMYLSSVYRTVEQTETHSSLAPSSNISRFAQGSLKKDLLIHKIYF